VLLRLTAAGVAATVSLALPSELLAGGEWPNGPNKTWFQNLQRPDNNQHPYRQSDPKSLFCCGIADTVKTKFKVDEWVPIPSEKIVEDHAPDGQPYLFMLSGTVQCFVRPKGGL